MTVKTVTQGRQTTFILTGRLDSATSPQLEELLDGVTEQTDKLVFDFLKLEYISSAGLRVLLKAQKLMLRREGVTLKNVDSTIREVLDVTGFFRYNNYN